jgi:hypothetical protein
MEQQTVPFYLSWIREGIVNPRPNVRTVDEHGTTAGRDDLVEWFARQARDGLGVRGLPERAEQEPRWRGHHRRRGVAQTRQSLVSGPGGGALMQHRPVPAGEVVRQAVPAAS